MSLILSPSAVAKFRDCKRAFAFEYNENLRPPSSPKQQFGTDVHAQLERWLRDGVAFDDSPAGKVARQAYEKGLLPVPGPSLLIEHRFGFSCAGIEVGGLVDCVDPSGPLVIDHKTTSDLCWSKTEEQLLGDPQVLIYGMWAMLKWDVPTVRARWIYYVATNPRPPVERAPAGVRPVEVLLSASSPVFRGHASRLIDDLEEMLRIRKSKAGGLKFPPSPEACGKFGGCFHAGRCAIPFSDRFVALFDKGR